MVLFEFQSVSFHFAEQPFISAFFSLEIFLHIEIQRGKFPMREQKYTKQLGGTAACTMRLVEGSHYSGAHTEQRRDAKKNGKRELFFGDSWFTSRRLCVFLKEKYGHEYFGALKSNHSGTPKEVLEKMAKDWPAGTYIVLRCKELGLFIVAYKYNYKKKGTLDCYYVTFQNDFAHW